MSAEYLVFGQFYESFHESGLWRKRDASGTLLPKSVFITQIKANNLHDAWKRSEAFLFRSGGVAVLQVTKIPEEKVGK